MATTDPISSLSGHAELIQRIKFGIGFYRSQGLNCAADLLSEVLAAKPVVYARCEACAAKDAEIAQARDACPSVRIQDNFDAPLLELINIEVSRGFRLDAQVYVLRAAEAFLEREGYRRCDIKHCKCGGFHKGGSGRALYRPY